MENPIKATPKDVFLYLFNIVTFYLIVVGFIMLCVQYVNALFPDTLDYYFTGIAGTVRTASSILCIAVPAYIISAWLLGKDLIKIPTKRDLWVRRWLTYFTLFVSAITIIIDLMIFVYNFLNGEISIRFFLKIFVVLLVACAVFGYYLWDLKRAVVKTKVNRIFAIALAVLVFGSIIGGFFIVGTPIEQRQRRMDEQRIADLQNIQMQIIDYWTRKSSLPKALVDLQDNISGFSVPQDPDLKKDYEYRSVEKLKFELCAEFARSNLNDPVNGRNTMGAYPVGPAQQSWGHETGRVCFIRTIDPELYKPLPATPEASKQIK